MTSFLNAAFVASSIATVIACAWALIAVIGFSLRSRSKSRATLGADFPLGPTGLFVVALSTTILLVQIEISRVRTEMMAALESLDDQARVTVNGSLYRDAPKLIAALKLAQPYAAHHSHPTQSISIVIKDASRAVALNLRRDSERRDEYWVFYDGSRITSINEIARITTTLLDEY